MLKQLLNGNNGLLLILTLNNTDLSLTCHYWVFLWLRRSVIVIFQSKLKYGISKYNSVDIFKIHQFKKMFKIRILDLCPAFGSKCFFSAAFVMMSLISHLSLDTWSHIMLTHISPHSIQPQCCFYLSYCLSERVFWVVLFVGNNTDIFVDFICISWCE